MKKIVLIMMMFVMCFFFVSCEDEAVSHGRELYQEHFKEVLKDPASFVVYSESYTKIDKFTVQWTLDYGAKNSFGGMVRETVKFKTCGSSIFFE